MFRTKSKTKNSGRLHNSGRGKPDNLGIPVKRGVFSFLLIILLVLVAILNRVQAQDTVEKSDGESTHSSGAGAVETTVETPNAVTEAEVVPTTAEPTTSTPEPEIPTPAPTEEVIYNTKVVKIGLIYQHEEHVPIFEDAIAHLTASSYLGLTYKVVVKFPAKKTPDALKLLVSLCKTMDELTNSENTFPDIMMDFTESGIPSESTKLIMKLLKIPTMATAVGIGDDVREWSKISSNEANYLIRIIPPQDMMDQAVRSLVELQNISNAAILFEKNYEISHKFKSILKGVPTFHKLETLETSNSRLTTQIKRVFKAKYSTIFFVAKPEVMTEIFKLREIQQRQDPLAIFVLSMVPYEKLTCDDCPTGDKFSVISVAPEPPKSRSPNVKTINDQFYFDLAVDTIKTVGRMKSEGQWPEKLERIPCVDYDFKARHSYQNRSIDLLSAFHNRPDRLGNIGYQKNGTYYGRYTMKIRKVHLSDGSSEVLGKWKAGFLGKNDTTLENHQSLELHRAPTVLNVVTVVQPPFVYWKENCKVVEIRKKEKNPFAHCFYGLTIDTLNAISRELKFNYTIYNISTYGWPTPLEWSGMVREVKDRKADLAVGAITLMPERENVIDFTNPFGPPVGFHFIMRKPVVPEAMFQFMTVLENDVWWCILAAYFFTTGLLFVFDRYSPSSYQNNQAMYDAEGPSRLFTIRECLWFCYSSMTPQGGGEAPKGLSGRLVASTWWLFSFIIIASYVANLAAFLTVSRLAKPISSMNELINQHRVIYYPVNESSAWYYFDRLAHVEQLFYERWRDLSLDDDLSDYNRSHLAVWTYPISDKYTKMWQALIENSPPATVQEAVERVAYGNKSNVHQKFAYIGEETDLKYATLIHCNIKTVGETFSHRPYAWMVQKNSPLKPMIDAVLKKMGENRELELYQTKWWKNNPHDKKCGRWYDVADGINWGNLSGVFLVFGCGLLSAVITTIVECVWCRCSNRTQLMSDTVSMAGDSIAGDDYHAHREYDNSSMAGDDVSQAPSSGGLRNFLKRLLLKSPEKNEPGY